jgi:hypothetical protein
VKERLRIARYNVGQSQCKCLYENKRNVTENYLMMTHANSDTIKTSAIWDFGTAEVASGSLVMESKRVPDDFLAASDEGIAGGPTQMVHRATYSETVLRFSDKSAPSEVQHFRGCEGEKLWS